MSGSSDTTGQHQENDFYADGRASDVFDGELIPAPQSTLDDLKKRHKELSQLTDAEVLLLGRRALFIDLVVMVEAGQAAPQEKAILAGLLKNSGLDMLDTERSPDGSYPEEDKAPLPTFDSPEYA